MNTWWIILIAVLLALVAYGVWLFSPPGAPRPLIPEDREKALLEHVPQDTRSGNSLETFTAFNPMVERMEEDIETAQRYIHLLFFKYEEDEVGRRVAERLARNAAAGVEVRILVDHAVNMGRTRFYDELRASGIQVKLFSPMHIPFMKPSDNYRNHRKIVVVDGRVAYVGGMNIAERYGIGLEWGSWRDTHIRIEGPAVTRCEFAFARDWAHKGGELLAAASYFPPQPAAGATDVDIVCSGPYGEGPLVMQRICGMLDASRHYAWLESPYLIPTREIRDSLLRAAGRGVDVRIIIPPRGDRGVLTPLCTNSYVEEMLEAGVRIARYRNGYMHSKTVVCDDRYVTVGSTNIDPRSYILDYEINAFIDDGAYASQMKSVFAADEAQSDYIDLAVWKRRGLLARAAESFARLGSAQF